MTEDLFRDKNKGTEKTTELVNITKLLYSVKEFSNRSFLFTHPFFSVLNNQNYKITKDALTPNGKL